MLSAGSVDREAPAVARGYVMLSAGLLREAVEPEDHREEDEEIGVSGRVPPRM